MNVVFTMSTSKTVSSGVGISAGFVSLLSLVIFGLESQYLDPTHLSLGSKHMGSDVLDVRPFVLLGASNHSLKPVVDLLEYLV